MRFRIALALCLLCTLPAASQLNKIDINTQTKAKPVADTGVADAYAVALSPAATSYVTGMPVIFTAAHTNTTTSTINVNSLGTKTIKKQGGSANVVAGDIQSGGVVFLIYDGTVFQMQTPPGASAGGSGTVTHTAGALTADLPVFGNGADDVKVGTKTGTGDEAVMSQSPVIVTPTVGSFANANHNHTNSAGGGQLTDAALSAAVGVPKGGTGAATFTNHGVLVGQGASPIVPTGTGSGGQCLISNGSGADPSFQACAGGGSGGATSVNVNGATQAATVNLNNTTPVATPGAGYDNAQFQTSTASSTSSVSVQTAVFSHNYRTAGTSATGSGSVSFGDDSGSGSATGNPNAGDANNSAFSQFNTTTTNNSSGNASGQASWRVGHNLYLWARLKISSTTAVRYCFGFESNSNGGAGGSFNAGCTDAFNGLFYVGFLYSTSLSHTQWQCVKNNQTAGITVAGAPTTAPDTTAWHIYEVIEESSGTFGCYIDGVKIANSIATGITAGTPLNSNVAVVCLTCTPTANNIKFNKIMWAATY